MPRDKYGNKLTGKEFMAKWKEGIANITPIQKIQNDLQATFIMTMGYVVGFISLIIWFDSFVVKAFTIGLMLIFLGAGYGSLTKLLSLRAQLKMIKEFDSSAIDLNKLEETNEN